MSHAATSDGAPMTAKAMMVPLSPDAVYERPRSDAEVVRLGFPGIED